MKPCECGCGVEPSGRQKRWASDACHSASRLKAAKDSRATAMPLLSKVCACGCGRPFTTRKPSHRFFSAQCGKNHWGRMPRAQREAHRAGKAARHPNTTLIHEAKAETPKGECIYCPNRTTTPRAFICGERECLTSYRRDYGIMRRKREKEARGRSEVLCRCGCGQRFIPHGGRQYVSNQHWLSARSAKRAARKALLPRAPRVKTRGPDIAFGRATESKVIRPFWRTA